MALSALGAPRTFNPYQGTLQDYNRNPGWHWFSPSALPEAPVEAEPSPIELASVAPIRPRTLGAPPEVGRDESGVGGDPTTLNQDSSMPSVTKDLSLPSFNIPFTNLSLDLTGSREGPYGTKSYTGGTLYGEDVMPTPEEIASMAAGAAADKLAFSSPHGIASPLASLTVDILTGNSPIGQHGPTYSGSLESGGPKMVSPGGDYYLKDPYETGGKFVGGLIGNAILPGLGMLTSAIGGRAGRMSDAMTGLGIGDWEYEDPLTGDITTYGQGEDWRSESEKIVDSFKDDRGGVDPYTDPLSFGGKEPGFWSRVGHALNLKSDEEMFRDMYDLSDDKPFEADYVDLAPFMDAEGDIVPPDGSTGGLKGQLQEAMIRGDMPHSLALSGYARGTPAADLEEYVRQQRYDPDLPWGPGTVNNPRLALPWGPGSVHALNVPVRGGWKEPYDGDPSTPGYSAPNLGYQTPGGLTAMSTGPGFDEPSDEPGGHDESATDEMADDW